MAEARGSTSDLPHVRLFDRLLACWESAVTRRASAWLLVAAFFLSIVSIELSRLGLLPTLFGKPLPTNHLAAISWVFTILLIIEVLDLIFGLAESVANALGKQLEIFSLILLRKAFDELPQLPEPIAVRGQFDAVLTMGAEVAGALVIFALLVPYYRIQRHQPISTNEDDVRRFAGLKKAVCLFLLAAFAVTGAFFGIGTLSVTDPDSQLSLDFFEVFYTVLVFADVLIVLSSMTVTREYRVVFRNFSFAAVTVFLRLALSAEAYLNSILGVATALFALAAAYVYAYSANEPRDAAP
ncbi:MAG: hypothetical protein AAFZ65_08960 [Planctomycetota bacterium]